MGGVPFHAGASSTGVTIIANSFVEVERPCMLVQLPITETLPVQLSAMYVTSRREPFSKMVMLMASDIDSSV